jgi:ADP-ribosylglycohydrolase
MKFSMLKSSNNCHGGNLTIVPARIRAAWAGRISGCLLGKPLEVLSFQEGRRGVESYLRGAAAWPLRDYVPLVEGTVVEQTGAACCRGRMHRAEPDDDINYTVLALLLLEEHGDRFDTSDVARSWLKLLPAGTTWTAERAAYRTLLDNMDDEFVNGAMYGWVCPGRPAFAADLAERDATLSHRGEGINGARFIAALGAAIPAEESIDAAIDVACRQIPADSEAFDAITFGRSLANAADAVDRLHEYYDDLSPVHTLNNLALVVWALCLASGDFGAVIGDTVAAGWDTDCNGATVGGLLGLSGVEIPESWMQPWQGRVGVSLAGFPELSLDDLVTRTTSVARRLQ